ncbi:charged multivesicular body protein-like protein 5 [Microthyrium microscopicum]|uniref:Charged multivesicular body protein-like protein 5 n=1 Tax=Microthyrium microscopicum TaxID=703497 RepID=A0A6A6UPR6_9PEZI|nr:charged multivesicular body protein-like protein 5 [Microthyrium microscopicum]
MNRLFGAKDTKEKPSLDTASTKLSAQIARLDGEVEVATRELTTILLKLKQKGPRAPPSLRAQAKKALEKQKRKQAMRDQLDDQLTNLQQAGMLQDNLRNTAITVEAMKTTTKELKKQYGKINIDQIDRLQDEMADLIEMGNEIQDSISRSYDVPEDIDEDELDAELEMLGEEVEMDALNDAQGLPSFMADEANLPSFIDNPPETSKVKEAAG